MRPIHREIEKRLGLLPNFFHFTSAHDEITDALWGFAKVGYLDLPLPSLLKERLFVYWSRFCPVKYCVARHLGFLLGLGYPAGDAGCLPQKIGDVLALLTRALPHGEELNGVLALFEGPGQPLEAWPQPDTPEETALIACSTHVLLQSPDAPRARQALRSALGTARLEYLDLFLAFVRMAHYWTQLHPELELERDVRELLATHTILAQCLMSDPAARATGLSREVLEDLAALRAPMKGQMSVA